MRLIHRVLCVFGIAMFAATACVPLSPNDDASAAPGPQDEHLGQTVQALTGRHKVCSAVAPGNYRDSIEVDDNWSITTCVGWVQSVNAGLSGSTGQLGCLFDNGFSWGSQGFGVPSPNCGW
jgi:hypothetical protein